MDHAIMPPWNLGDTFYGIGGSPSSTDVSNLVGKEYIFERPALNAGVAVGHAGKFMRVRVVRNASAITLLPRQGVSFKTGSTTAETEVDGYGINAAAGPTRVFPVDEFLPAAGVVANDLFYIVMYGPAEMLLPLTGAGFNGDISVGNQLVSSTGTTTSVTTSGRVGNIDTTGATSPLATNIMNRIGRALSAATTAQSTAGQKMLVSIGRF